MSASEKIPLSGLSRGELEALAERLLAENAALKQAIAELRAEVAALKGVKGRPKVRPSGMDEGTELAPAGASRGAKGSKVRRLTPHEERVIAADVPAGSRFKGYEDFLVQDLVLRPHVVRLRRERWLTPDGRTVTAPLPAGLVGHFGPELRRFVLFQYHQGQVTVPRLVAQLRAIGIAISKRQVVRLLNEGQSTFLDEARDVLRAGLSTAAWISADDTGARHQHRNAVCTQLGNDHFTAFATTASKSRLNFLEVLRAGFTDYVINAEALVYMRQRALAGPVIASLAAHPERQFADEAAWLRHLERLGIAALTVTPDPVRIATEGAIWGSVKAHGLLPDTVILSDDAGQFALDRHALCWVHAERLVHKLDTFTDRQHAAQQLIRALIWWFYADLKAYRRAPDRRRRYELRARFDRIFRRRTGFVTLDRLLARLHANKDELLVVLDRPEVPLHTNHRGPVIRLRLGKRSALEWARRGSGRCLCGGARPRTRTWPMGCGALESGDAPAAIPVRKLISFAQPSPSSSSRRTTMANAKQPRRRQALPPVHAHAAAIDIGATLHVAAVGPDRDPEPVRTFGTFTNDLHRMADWFAACGIETIVMESTGVYWIPAYEILAERGFDVQLVNARDAKHVPGRKTDVSDAQWLQRLHEHGLLRASFQPKGEITVLRAYLRQRERLLDYAASHIQHMQKALMQMNLQLHHVVADITGLTGLRIIRAIAAGERDPRILATYRDHRCHASAASIRQALVGNYREEHVFALTQALELYDVYQAQVDACDARIKAVLERLKAAAPSPAGPLPAARARRRQANAPGFDVRAALHALLGVDLTQIHGLGPYLALKLVAECGTDLAAWPSAKHFTSWLGLAPGNKISGGKVLSARTRRSGSRAASLLRLAARTVGRTPTALGAFYRRLSARIGKAKAITATARKIAVLFYNTLRHGMSYTDPGASYYEERYRQRVLANLRRRAKALGYALQEIPPEAAVS